MNKSRISHDFLQEFVKELILCIKEKKNIPDTFFPIKQQRAESYQNAPRFQSPVPRQTETIYPNRQIKFEEINQEKNPSLPTNKHQFRKIKPFPRQIPKQNFSSKYPAQSMRSIQPMSVPMPSPDQKISSEEIVNLGKLNQLMKDPAVQIVECPGPSKKVLVKRGAQILKTQMTLTKDEIKQLIDDFSKKSKVPVIEGVFKAIAGNLIITAVISEFVGTRFMIQKRMSLPRQNQEIK